MKTKQKGMAAVGVLLCIIAVLIIGGGFYIYHLNGKLNRSNVNNENSANPTNQNNQQSNPGGQAVANSREAYPYMNTEGNLVLYFFDDGTRKTVDTNIDMFLTTGEGPGLSPANSMTAYIKDGVELRTIDHLSLNKETLFKTDKPRHRITEVRWSPIGNHILFFVGDVSPTPQLGDSDITGGEYKVYDYQTAKITTLPSSIKSFDSFLDETHIIVAINGKLEIFNLDTMKVDVNAYSNKISFLKEKAQTPAPTSYHFSKDGTIVTYSQFNNNRLPNGDQNIDFFVGNMNSKTSTRVTPADSFVSMTALSHDGKTIAYALARSRYPATIVYDLMIYDVASKKSQKIMTDGFPVRWLDNDRLVFMQYAQTGSTKTTFYTYNKSTQKLTEMYGIEH